VLAFIALTTIFIVWAWRFVGNVEEGYEEQTIIQQMQQAEARQREVESGDYWEEEEVHYDTGEIVTNRRPTIRHPKNRDRAYEGSA